MISARKIKDHYQLTPEEENLLGELRPIMKEHRDGFTDDLYNYIMAYDDMAIFFADEDKLNIHKMKLAGWFMRLFSGKYDETYIRNLTRVGDIHVKIKLEGHLVNSSMARVRHFLTKTIDSHIPEEDRVKTLTAVNKILDINLDVMTSSYRHAELQKFFLSYRVENTLISWMERFTYGLNLVLALALGMVSIAVVFLFVHDAAKIFQADKMESAVITALGTMLIIWMMVELLDTEILHLKGHKIPIKIFIGVVMVAFIRKVLIASFQHTPIEEYASKVLTLLILGIVYWLVTKADRA